MKVAISLIWLRHKVAGGVESFTRNILDGLKNDSSDNQYYLLCSKDNKASFVEYSCDARFSIIECPVTTANLRQTLLYESFKLDKLITKLKVDLCFVPSYRMPLVFKKNKYVVVIHDLISCNYPQLFSWKRKKWLNYASKRAANNADKVVTISNFVKEDIVKRFGIMQDKISTIYNPILPSKDAVPFQQVSEKYGIKENQYFYTVSSLAANKNLMTLLRLMNRLQSSDKYCNYKLLISGVGLSASAKSRFDVQPYLDYIKENGLGDKCILTGFVSNEERNTLIIGCSFFLFASIFEGFGMPVVEALELGAKVLTTKCASLPEVSHNKAFYVEDPYNVDEWCGQIDAHINDLRCSIHFGEYEINNVIRQYLEEFALVSNS